MTISTITIIIICFFILGEILTWLFNKDNLLTKSHISAIRCAVIILAISIIHIEYSKHKDYKFLQDEYDFNKNLIIHQDSLINYQRTMMDDLANHLWEDHDCDIPQYDGDLKFLIDYETEIVDSLHNIKE